MTSDLFTMKSSESVISNLSTKEPSSASDVEYDADAFSDEESDAHLMQIPSVSDDASDASSELGSSDFSLGDLAAALLDDDEESWSRAVAATPATRVSFQRQQLQVRKRDKVRAFFGRALTRFA
jgi:hypothetical protein